MDHAASYAVVFFKEDRTFSEIPSSWLLPTKTSCWWPSGKNVSSLISKKSAPDRSIGIWNIFDVEVLGYYDTLDAARRRALDSDCTSGEDEKGRGYRRKKKSVRIISDSEDESHSSKENTPPPALSLSQNQAGNILSTCDNSENTPRASLGRNINMYLQGNNSTMCDNTENTPRSSLGRNINMCLPGNSSTMCDNTGNLSMNVPEIYSNKTLTEKSDYNEVQELREKIDYVIKINKKILMYVKEIDAKLEKNELSEKKISNQFKGIQNKLPVQTIEDLQEIDTIIKDDDDLKENFVNYVKSIGGRSTKEMISRVMLKIMTNSVGIGCSLLGKRNHVAFKKLTIMNIITSAVQEVFSEATESSVELAVAEWLRLSKLRQSREK